MRLHRLTVSIEPWLIRTEQYELRISINADGQRYEILELLHNDDDILSRADLMFERMRVELMAQLRAKETVV